MRSIIFLIILLAFIIFSESADASSTIYAGTNFTGTSTQYEMIQDMPFSESVSLIGNELSIDSSSWKLTGSSGMTRVNINSYNATYWNMTVTTPSSQAIEFNLTGFTPGITIQILKDDVQQTTTSADGGGFLSYTSGAFNGGAEWVFKETAAASLAVTLSTPADATSYEYSPSLETDPFTASVVSPNTVQNCTLFSNSSGSWSDEYLNETTGDGTKYLGTLSGLSLGDYIWNAYCCDTSDCNWSTSNYTFTVEDTTNPFVELTLNQTTVEAGTGRILIESTITEFLLSSALLNVSLSGTSIATNTTENGSLSLSWSDFGELGTFLVNASALDTSGNLGYNDSSFDVTDTVAPTGTIAANVTSLEANSTECFELNGTADDVLIDVYSLRIYNASGDQLAENLTLNGSLVHCWSQGEGLGIWQGNMTANDTSGNEVSINLSITFSDTTPPSVSQVSPGDGASTSMAANLLTCSATDATGVDFINFWHNFTGDYTNVTNSTLSADQSSVWITTNRSLGDTLYWFCEACDLGGLCANTTERSLIYQSYSCGATLENGSDCLASSYIGTNMTNYTLSGVGNCSISCEMPLLNGSQVNATQFDACNYAVVNGSQFNRSINGCDLWFHSMEILDDRCRANITHYYLNSSIGPCAVIMQEQETVGGANLGAIGASIIITGIFVFYNYTKVEE